MERYYRQRATAGLILSEALPVDSMGVAYARVPGIWNGAQVERWKVITDGVRAKGGTIFAQLWHGGRISHSVLLKGRIPVAPSAIRPAGHVSLVRPTTSYEKPGALETHEVKQILELFARCCPQRERRRLRWRRAPWRQRLSARSVSAEFYEPATGR